MWRVGFDRDLSATASVFLAVEDGARRRVRRRAAHRGTTTPTPDAGEVGTIYLLETASGTRHRPRAARRAVIGRAAGAGYERATLWVLEANERARRFYEAARVAPDGATRRPPARVTSSYPVVRYAIDL